MSTVLVMRKNLGGQGLFCPPHAAFEAELARGLWGWPEHRYGLEVNVALLHKRLPERKSLTCSPPVWLVPNTGQLGLGAAVSWDQTGGGSLPI